MGKYALSYKEVEKIFSNNGCKLLSSEYKGLKTKLEYIAQCGHRLTTTACNFFRGAGKICRRCNPNYHRIYKDIPISEIREEYKREGCLLLSDSFGGYYGKLEYVARCGHKHSMPYYCFHRGQGRRCPRCAGGVRKTIDEVREIFRREGCELLSPEYKWNRQKVDYIARCGHKHRIKASAFFEGEGRSCPKCKRRELEYNSIKYKEEDQRRILKENNCILIEAARTMNDKMIYIAECGHKVSMRMVYFLKGQGRKCKRCYQKCISKGERAIKRFLLKEGYDFASQYSISTGSKSRQLLDFYIPKLRIAIEYNGRQHYEENLFFHGRRSHKKQYDFNYTQEKDKSKREWCETNGVRLIEIDGRIWNAKRVETEEFNSYLIEQINIRKE